MIGSFFATDFDEPAAALPLPADVTGGQDPGVAIVDQVVRGSAIVGRVTGDFGAVALTVEPAAAPVRVAVLVHLDELGTRWWSDRVRPPRTAPELPRLVTLRSQGVLRGAALLARRQGLRGAGGVRAELSFELSPAELGRLLVVELGSAALPDWAAGRVAGRSPLGVRFDRIGVGTAPAGGPAADPTRPSGCDLALVPAGVRRFRLEPSAVPVAPPLPRSPSHAWTRRKPARAVFKAGRIGRRAALRTMSEVMPARSTPDVAPAAADLTTGAPLDLTVEDRGPAGVTLSLPAPAAGPVLVGTAAPARGLSLRVVPA